MSFFSIIIPTYNRAQMLTVAIDSVISQTFQDWELIIVDDGSTDNTKELVQHYEHKDQRIKYHYQENAERSAARNKGIDLSKGEYICFLDSDDVYLNNHLQTFYEFIKFSKNSTKTLFYTLKTGEKTISYPNKYLEVYCSAIHSQQICGHHSIFLKHKYDKDINIGEDKELLIRIISEFEIEQIPICTVKIINHIGRTVHYKNIDSYKKNLELIKGLSLKYDQFIPQKTKDLEISNALFSLSKSYMYNKDFTQAKHNLKKSLFQKFFNNQTKHKLLLLLALSGLYKKDVLKEYLTK